ncbi:MAG: AAA family ATPase [Proteobacteria bacterium]|uniref:AAA family ATPase n=1 Tax=Candidatus Avisuccinivibrio stercorigallinarum TaxID=2840704 RepID=A0A9D9D9I0_9GAMM|nr:AAA family ATPase [Candidatus Avisuccinivibrio stercorigallinarum]
MTIKLPAGISSFAQLRAHNMLYVDKTACLAALCQNEHLMFLCRPHSYGLSTALSTLEELWRHGVQSTGQRPSYFDGLKVSLQWTEEPRLVLRFDFKELARQSGGQIEAFTRSLSKVIAASTGRPELAALYPSAALDKFLGETDDGSVVVLIDDAESVFEKLQPLTLLPALLTDFYDTLRRHSRKLRFAAVFAHFCIKELGLFNELCEGEAFADLSADPRYLQLCGFSDFEIYHSLAAPLAAEYALPWVHGSGSFGDDTLYHDLKQLDDEFGALSFSRAQYLPQRQCKVIITLLAEQSVDPRQYWLQQGRSIFVEGALRRLRGRLNELDDYIEVESTLSARVLPVRRLPPVLILAQAGFVSTADSIYSPFVHFGYSCPRARAALQKLYKLALRRHAAND